MLVINSFNSSILNFDFWQWYLLNLTTHSRKNLRNIVQLVNTSKFSSNIYTSTPYFLRKSVQISSAKIWYSSPDLSRQHHWHTLSHKRRCEWELFEEKLFLLLVSDSEKYFLKICFEICSQVPRIWLQKNPQVNAYWTTWPHIVESSQGIFIKRPVCTSVLLKRKCSFVRPIHLSSLLCY
jgi:hypothetical protein